LGLLTDYAGLPALQAAHFYASKNRACLCTSRSGIKIGRGTNLADLLSFAKDIDDQTTADTLIAFRAAQSEILHVAKAELALADSQ
jgi:hypothetical protein